ncbi:inositol monophosphatase 3-like [Dysidea avara]|uniref:inositol monophosphatase 3-like n=1 Tax=Dysidea avara TaxID=196820 RepID=UPI003323A064
MVKMSDVKINRPAVIFVVVFILLIFFYVFSGRISVWKNEETVKISEILSAAIDLAKQGGKKVVEIRNSDNVDFNQLSKGKTKEGKDEFVTAGDHKSHEIITSGLKAGWPTLKYQSEETDNVIVQSLVPHKHNREVNRVLDRDEEVPLSEVLVWIDPLDATQEYTEGKTDKSLLKYVTVMVCVVVKDIPVAGVIYQAFEEKMYWGWVGHGTSDSVHELLEQRKQQMTKEGSVNIVISRSHSGDAKKFISTAFPDSGNTKATVDEAAGSGYKVLEVLRGADDVYFHLTLIKKWDLCAGNALLYAVHGNMTTRNGDAIDYSFQGNPKNEHGVVATLEKHGYFVNKLKK